MLLVIQAIAGWSSVEVHLGDAFATLIGAKKRATMEMYAAFDSFAVQRQMLVTAAENTLPKRYSQILKCTLTVLNKHALNRHKFAHCVWGTTPDPTLADGLILVSPEHFWRLRIKRIRHWSKAKATPNQLVALIKNPKLDPEVMFVYRKKELEKICEQMEQAYIYAEAVCRLASSKTSVRRDAYNWLRNQSEIHEALEKDRQRQQKSRIAGQKPPRGVPRAERRP